MKVKNYTLLLSILCLVGGIQAMDSRVMNSNVAVQDDVQAVEVEEDLNVPSKKPKTCRISLPTLSQLNNLASVATDIISVGPETISLVSNLPDFLAKHGGRLAGTWLYYCYTGIKKAASETENEGPNALAQESLEFNRGVALGDFGRGVFKGFQASKADNNPENVGDDARDQGVALEEEIADAGPEAQVDVNAAVQEPRVEVLPEEVEGNINSDWRAAGKRAVGEMAGIINKH